MLFKVRRIFNFRGRKLRLSFRNWRERTRKGAFLRYYMHRPKEDTRSVLGKKLDILGGLLLAWIVVFFLLASLTGRPLTALALSLPLPAAGALLSKKLLEAREHKNRLRRRLWLAGQKFMDDILKMEPQKEFVPCVRDILAALPGFQSVRLNKRKSKEGGRDKQGIDLEGMYRGALVAVCCRRQEGNKKIGPGEIRAFAGAMHLEGYKNGLFVTSGDFRAGALAVVNEARRRGINIKLVNRYGLMDLARQAGAGAFRTENALPRARSRAGNEKQPVFLVAAFRDSAFASRKKAKSYFLYGLLLYGGYILLKGHNMLSLLYLFFAVLNFLMCACCLCFGKSVEEIDPLEGLGPEK